MSIEYFRSPEGQKALRDAGFVDCLTEQTERERRERAAKSDTTQQNDNLDIHAPEDTPQIQN